jgi:hypothetical protein
MSRLVRKPVTLFSFAFFVLLVPVFWWVRYAPKAPEPAAAAIMPPEVRPPDFKVLLIRAGLDADALAAAGVSSGTVASVVAAAQTSMQANVNALVERDASFASARVEAERLKTLIESGRAAQEDVSSYTSASSSLTTATSQRQSTLDSVFAAATANLTSGQRTAITNIRANRSWNLPLEFLVVNREQTEWVQLRDALANERISAKLGEDPDASAQMQLSNWRAHGSVAAARSALQSNLAQVRTNWNAAAGD